MDKDEKNREFTCHIGHDFPKDMNSLVVNSPDGKVFILPLSPQMAKELWNNGMRWVRLD